MNMKILISLDETALKFQKRKESRFVIPMLTNEYFMITFLCSLEFKLLSSS